MRSSLTKQVAFVATLFACASAAEAADGIGGPTRTAAASSASTGKAAAAEELWLAVALNGQLTGTTALVRYDRAGNLWVAPEDLKAWRLPLPDESDTSLAGTALYPLQAFDGLAFKVDEETQTLTIDAPAHLFEQVHIAVSARDQSHVTAPPPGGFFNYDVYATQGNDNVATSALLEGGVFGRWGTGITRFIERSQTAGAASVRLDSTWTIDRPESRASLRIGDAITGASASWGGAVRFGGVQWATNFSTQPGLVTMPLASVAGESALPSTLELYVNDALRMRQQVPGGPFTLNDVPTMSGDGQIRVVVRDLLGREQVITQSYYASPRMLRKGLHEFSFEAGAARDNFGRASNDYGRPLLVGTERYGLSNHLTGEVHAEMLEEQQTIGLSAAVLAGKVGILSLSVAGSRSDAGMGQLASFGFERTSGRLSIGMNAEAATETFTRIGLTSTERVPKLRSQLFANVGLRRAGSISFAGTRQQFYDGEVRNILSLRHSLDIRGLGYLNLSAMRVAGLESETSYAVTFARSLGRLGSSSMSVRSSADGVSGYAQMQKGMPAGTGFGYRLRARAGQLRAAEGGVSYQNAIGSYSIEAQQVEDELNTRASISGGLAIMNASFFPSRRIENSFAIARVGEEANVRIYRDNQLVARTNAAGYAILPGLRAYEDNQISIEQADLPLDAAVKSLRESAVPPYRSGVLLTFPVERARGALLTVVIENGEPLPPGATVTVVGQSDTYPTAMNGEVYIDRLADRNVLRAEWPGGLCEFDVAYTPSDDPLPRLGPYECRRVTP